MAETKKIKKDKGFAKYDQFGHKVQPNFNRKDVYKTSFGGIATISLGLLLLVYFIFTIINLQNGYPHLIHTYGTAIEEEVTFSMRNSSYMPIIMFYNSTYTKSKSIIYDHAVFDEFISIKYVQF